MNRPCTILAAALAVACSASTTRTALVPAKPPTVKPAAAPIPDPDAWRDTRPPTGKLVDHPYPDVQTARLDNGLTLYVVDKKAGVVTMSLVAKSAASRLPVGKSGLSAFTVRLMTEGTAKHGSLALAEAVESMGTTLEESAGRDYVRLGMTTLREDLRNGLSLLAEVAQKPAFATDEIERVRHEWLDSIEAERQSPGRLSAVVGLRLLLGKAVGAPVNGSRHDIAGLRRRDLVEFYETHFVPNNLALVVVGDITLADVRPIAKELFGAWHASNPKPAADASIGASPAHEIFFVDRPGAVQSALFVAQSFPKRSAPGYESRELLNDLLGGVFTSRLNMNLREKNAFTYGANSLDLATRDWGAFAVMTSVRTDVTGPALSEALSELTKAKDPALGRPITDAEVALARVDLKQHLGATLSDTDDVGDRVEDLFLENLDSDYYGKYPALLDAATPVTVAAEARRLDPDHSVVVIVGDRSAVAAQLSKVGLKIETVSDSMTD